MSYNLERYNIDYSAPVYQEAVKFYDYYVFVRNATPDTMRGKVCSLNHFLRYSQIKTVDEITNSMIFEWIADQKKHNNKASTINNRRKHLLTFVKYCRSYGHPVEGVNILEIPKQLEETPHYIWYTRETVYQVLRYADRREWLMIKILFDCGLRIHELQQIRLRNMNSDEVGILGKGRKWRPIILSPEVMVRLEDYIRRYQITDWLWPNHRGDKPLAIDTIRRAMRKAFEVANIEGFKPHQLRHSYANDLVKLGATVRQVQQGLGHSSAITTEIYLQDLTADSLRQLCNLKYNAKAPELI